MEVGHEKLPLITYRLLNDESVNVSLLNLADGNFNGCHGN